MEDETSVRVALRIRPQSAAERIDMCRVCTCVTPGHPQVVLGKDKAFTFDHVFDIESKQCVIYEQCLRGLVDGCLDGYNATVLAYGQTGSGKTYTMGTGFDVAISAEEEGIIPRAVAHLFEGIDKRKHDAKQRNEPQPDFKVTVQFMELYNEELMDLFDFDNNRGRKSNVKIHEDANGNIYTMGVTMKPVNSAQDTLNCLQQGALSRTTASTNMNAQSSRSHAIFTIYVKQQRVVKLTDADNDKRSSDKINNYEYEMLTAKFNFVDLAGSERLKRTGATGDRAKEGISINCGLLALGNVISALGDATKKGSHVPYRDSKLTRLLQDSLGGNSRTLMIACVSPSDRDFMETLNTLKYANRARNIKNKVVVNQDKTSKQMSALRVEIQKLTVELMEYKQGKRVSGVEGDQVSDVCHENVMLKTENDKLRVRIKALQQTIDTQSARITDLISSQVLAELNGEVDGGVEDLIQKYLKEIEELRNKLTESEAMAMAITRHAALKSRMTSPSSNENTTSVLEMAKMDLAKQRQKAQKLSREEDTKDQPWGEHSSDESSTEEEDEENEEDNSEGNEGQADDVDDDDDDDDDDDSDEDETLQDLSGSLANLSTEISIKEKLIDELETSQKKLQTLKTQYEEKLSLLHNKIKETETERDHVLQNIKNQDSKSEEKVRHIRDDYEKKISRLQGELKKMQAAKKEHARLLRQKAQNEQQLRTFQGELSELKKTKVRLMKQMKEEAAKNKQQEARRNKEIAQLKKESRVRQMTIKNLEMEKRQREVVLKRKQEEVKALRRQQKPVSGQLGTQRNQTTSSSVREVNGVEESTHTYSSSSYSSYSSSTVSVSASSSNSRFLGAAGRSSGLPVKSPRRKSSVQQASRSAKKKWDVIDKKISSLIIKRQTISNMESDMDRWIQDRDRLSKQLEKCQMKYDNATVLQREESNVQELKEQLEALTAHVDYVQENITDCQTSIMEMEEQGGDTAEIGEFFATCTLTEARILLEHFLTKVISLGHEASSKEASAKEVEARLNAMKQHNELQQELLQHVLQYHDSFSSIENLAAAAIGTDSELSGSELRDRLRGSLTSLTSLDSLKDEAGSMSRSSSNNTIKDSGGEGQPQPAPKPKDKARRRTGTQEEFLYPDRIKTRRDPRLDPVGDEDEASGSESNLPLVPALPCPSEPKGARQISPELMQKLLELEKSRKAQSSETLMPPPPGLQGSQIQSQGGPVKTSRSNSLNGNGTAPVPASMVRGNVKSKSARSFPVSKYGNTGSSVVIQPRSQPTSPALQRRSLPDKPGAGVDDSALQQKTSEDVFARLTSSLAQESDPDIGRMLPLRPPAGKPAPLVCTYAATGHNSAVLSLDVTEDLMFTGSKDRTVKVWDLNTGEETLSCAGLKRDVVSVRYCPKTQRIFGASQNIVKVWDIRDGKCIKSLTPPGSSLGSFLSSMTSETQINDLKLSADGALLFAAMGTTVRIWDLDSYTMTGKLGGHAGPVMTVLVKETNKESVVFTGSRDHYVKIFEVNGSNVGVQSARSKLEPPHYDGVQSLALKGKYLFSGSRDNSIKKWDIESQQLVQHVTAAHKDWVCALDFLRPQNVLLSGCRGGLLKLWRVENGAAVCEIKAHRHPINAICTNSSCVFTASSDRLVRLWRVTGTLDEQLNELKRSVEV